jgi:hypothetical protein
VTQEGFSSAASRELLDFNHAPLQWILGILFPEEKRPGVKMIIYSLVLMIMIGGMPLTPVTSWRAQETFASIQKKYIKTGSNFVIKFIIFLEIILKFVGV